MPFPKVISTHLVSRCRLTPRWELAITAIGLVVIAELIPNLLGVLPGDWFWWLALRVIWPLTLLFMVLVGDIDRIVACLPRRAPTPATVARGLDLPPGPR
jgi:hypothetical protein